MRFNCKTYILLTTDGFVSNQAADDSTSDGLSGGQITGIVFAFLILTALFVGAIFIILRPPDALKPYLAPPPNTTGSSGGHAVSSRQLAEQEMRQSPPQTGFDNPLANEEGSQAQSNY